MNIFLSSLGNRNKLPFDSDQDTCPVAAKGDTLLPSPGATGANGPAGAKGEEVTGPADVACAANGDGVVPPPKGEADAPVGPVWRSKGCWSHRWSCRRCPTLPSGAARCLVQLVPPWVSVKSRNALCAFFCTGVTLSISSLLNGAGILWWRYHRSTLALLNVSFWNFTSTVPPLSVLDWSRIKRTRLVWTLLSQRFKN